MLAMSSSGFFVEHQEIGGLALGERAEILVDAEELRIVLGEHLDDLHRREPGRAQELHLPMLGEALDEIAVGIAAGVGAEADAARRHRSSS